MKKLMKKLIACLTVLCLLQAGALASTYVSDADPDYVPVVTSYDPAPFLAKCDTLEGYVAAGETEQALALFDELDEELDYLVSLYSTAYIVYCEDVTNDDAYEMYSDLYDTTLDCYDRLWTIGMRMATGDMADSFRTYLGDDALFDEYGEYQEMTDREEELAEREEELITAYDRLIEDIDSITYEYKGEVYCYSDLLEDDAIEKTGYFGYLTIYEGIMASLNEKAGAIFLELVQIRNEIAQIEGYDNYCDYADDMIYYRDYGTDEAETFESTVKSFFADFEIGWEGSYNVPEKDLSAEEQIAVVRQMLQNVSPLAAETVEWMEEHHLTSIGGESERAERGYTVALPMTEDGGFIFNKTTGSLSDVEDLIHEVGHLTSCHFAGTEAFDLVSNDVSEIHSQGLEALAVPFYKELYGQRTSLIMEEYVVEGLLYAVQTGCLYDEWQRAIYSDLDMTLEEINELYVELCDEYGMDDLSAMRYDWVWVTHNFNSPMYYISYATSAIAAIDLYVLSLTDYDAAVAIWEYVVNNPEGAYLEVVESAGLTPFTDSEGTLAALEKLGEHYNSLIG